MVVEVQGPRRGYQTYGTSRTKADEASYMEDYWRDLQLLACVSVLRHIHLPCAWYQDLQLHERLAQGNQALQHGGS